MKKKLTTADLDKWPQSQPPPPSLDIDKGVFYSKINEFFQYFEYKVDGQIWEDTQPGYIPQWEELFEQLGIPFE